MELPLKEGKKEIIFPGLNPYATKDNVVISKYINNTKSSIEEEFDKLYNGNDLDEYDVTYPDECDDFDSPVIEVNNVLAANLVDSFSKLDIGPEPTIRTIKEKIKKLKLENEATNRLLKKLLDGQRELLENQREILDSQRYLVDKLQAASVIDND